MIGKDANAAEEAGQNHLAAESIASAGKHPVVRYDTQPGSQSEDVPSVFSQNGHGGFRPRHGIAFACDGFNERGFATAVGPENGNVLVGADAQAEVIKRGLLSAHYSEIMKVQQGWV